VLTAHRIAGEAGGLRDAQRFRLTCGPCSQRENDDGPLNRMMAQMTSTATKQEHEAVVIQVDAITTSRVPHVRGNLPLPGCRHAHQGHWRVHVTRPRKQFTTPMAVGLVPGAIDLLEKVI